MTKLNSNFFINELVKNELLAKLNFTLCQNNQNF